MGVGCSGGHLLDHFARSAHNSCVLSPCAQRVPHPTGGRAQCVLFRRYTSLDASCGAFLSAEWFRLDETKLEANKYGDQQLWWDFAEVSDARIGGRSASCNLRRQHSCGVRRVPHLDQHRSSGAWARPRTRPWIRAWARTWPRPWLLAWWRMGAGALPQRVEQPALLLLLSHSELRVMAGRDSGRSFLASRRECELNGQATARIQPESAIRTFAPSRPRCDRLEGSHHAPHPAFARRCFRHPVGRRSALACGRHDGRHGFRNSGRDRRDQRFGSCRLRLQASLLQQPTGLLVAAQRVYVAAVAALAPSLSNCLQAIEQPASSPSVKSAVGGLPKAPGSGKLWLMRRFE